MKAKFSASPEPPVTVDYPDNLKEENITGESTADQTQEAIVNVDTSRVSRGIRSY